MRGGRLLLVATVLIVAANLRPAITVVGPLVETIGEDAGLDPIMLGLLGGLPVLTLGLVSPGVHAVSARIGVERCILVAMVLLALGTGVRSLPVLAAGPSQAHAGIGGLVGLYLGTVIIGAAIAVANVLVPAVVKRDFPDRVSLMTGLYAATMVAGAAVGSAAAVPLAAAVGWAPALMLTGLWAVLGAAVWALRGDLRRDVRRSPTGSEPSPIRVGPGSTPSRRPTMWTSAVAWQVTAFFGLQSSIFYFMLTWFVSVLVDDGVDADVAGWALAAYQAVGVAGSLAVGSIMQRTRDQRGVILALGCSMTAALTGFALVPELYPVWTLIGGVASGTTLMVALSLVGLRSGDSFDAARLSGMAQGIGYTSAALGPFLAGALYGAVESWSIVLLTFAAVAVVQTVVGLRAGRDVTTDVGP
ncbi:MAG: MFS transporter [Nesterenkonia sp.]|nr:MFS transporter [Nesterenkonia sp.]